MDDGNPILPHARTIDMWMRKKRGETYADQHSRCVVFPALGPSGASIASRGLCMHPAGKLALVRVSDGYQTDASGAKQEVPNPGDRLILTRWSSLHQGCRELEVIQIVTPVRMNTRVALMEVVEMD